MRFTLFALLFLLSGCELFNNFHEVEANNLYRSAQLSGKEFETAIKAFEIKTIVNLRGENPDENWYQEEIAVAEKFGVEHK